MSGLQVGESRRPVSNPLAAIKTPIHCRGMIYVALLRTPSPSWAQICSAEGICPGEGPNNDCGCGFPVLRAVAFSSNTDRDLCLGWGAGVQGRSLSARL